MISGTQGAGCHAYLRYKCELRGHFVVGFLSFPTHFERWAATAPASCISALEFDAQRQNSNEPEYSVFDKVCKCHSKASSLVKDTYQSMSVFSWQDIIKMSKIHPIEIAAFIRQKKSTRLNLYFYYYYAALIHLLIFTLVIMFHILINFSQ